MNGWMGETCSHTVSPGVGDFSDDDCLICGELYGPGTTLHPATELEFVMTGQCRSGIMQIRCSPGVSDLQEATARGDLCGLQ